MTLRQTTIKAIADLCDLAERLQITPREQFDGDAVAEKIWAVTATLEVDEASDPEDVISALRLAEVGTSDAERFQKVAHELLTCAPETDDENTGGPALLLRLHRDGVLKFEIAEA